MVSPDFVDPYLIPGTTVLRNIVGASTVSELAAAEADLSFARALQLLDSPVTPSNDLHELKEIHRRLFQDVHYEKINYIHPFREGNGRAQRIFWNRLALEAGWQLDWRPVHGEENHAAARVGDRVLRRWSQRATHPDLPRAADPAQPSA